MNWFRKHVKSGSGLALLALAIQFALSFGHFHGEMLRAAPVLQAALTDVGVQSPADRDTDRHGTDCAICAVLSLANNFLSVSPPLLALPQTVALVPPASRAEFAHLSSVHTAFQSRAPPAS
jgi:hypothetical protein